MSVNFTQFYIEPKVFFNLPIDVLEELSGCFSRGLSISGSPKWKYDTEYKLLFIISAKSNTSITEIKGPSVSKKYKSVEYVLYLPYDTIKKHSLPLHALLMQLVEAISVVLDKHVIQHSQLEPKLSAIVQDISSVEEYQRQLFVDSDY